MAMTVTDLARIQEAKRLHALNGKLTVADVKQLGSMVVADVDRDFDVDPNSSLIELQKFTGKELVADYANEFAAFSTTPFDTAGHMLRLFPGGVTIWSGFPGTGKTSLLRQLVCHLLKSGEGVFFASLEEHPKHLLVRLGGTASGREVPTSDQMQWFIDCYVEKLRVWGVIGLAEHRQLLAVIRKLAEQGVTHAVIDSLMCMDIPNDDTEKQRQFANLVAATARASNIHIHLVAHPRKLVTSDQEPDINDVAGAREIGGIADNVIFVRRDRNESHDPKAVVTPMRVTIRKQRHGTGSVGDITGWFHRGFRQFQLDQFAARPARYLPNEAFGEEAETKWWEK
jgi:twinkle protein